MTIFNNYTGNAMLNNALQTIEAMANLNHVSQITSELLLELFSKTKLWDVNKRLKNYTMLFSLNNPLVNPAEKENSVTIYRGLIQSIIQSFENAGDHTCEISGLKYSKSFEEYYRDEVEKLKSGVKKKQLTKVEEKKILNALDGKDTAISRCWFPLVGSLGSDAQALPQAKFYINIHPICLAIIQFLPLSSLLYKGSILLVDSINFDFTREYIKQNLKELQHRINIEKPDAQIENIKHNKQHYILKGLQILDEKELEDDYSDLNLWAFSNSGTGPKCEIDRIPNYLFKDLRKFQKKSSRELEQIIKGDWGNWFLDSLIRREDFPGLYPAKNYSGASVIFFETYQQIIGNEKYLSYAKYIAGLISKYKTKSDEKLLVKTDAYRESEFRTLFYSTLVKASESKKWNLVYHSQILNEPQKLPINSNTSLIHKLTFFYYWNKYYIDEIDSLEINEVPNQALDFTAFIANLINNDLKKVSLIKDLTNPQRYRLTSLNRMLVRAHQKVNLSTIFHTLYEDFSPSKYGLLDILRIYYLNPFPLQSNFSLLQAEPLLEVFHSFADDYIRYYFNKYQDTIENLPIEKFQNHVLKNFPDSNEKFMIWFFEAVEKINDYAGYEKWNDDILYDSTGNFNLNFSKLAIEFALNQNYKKQYLTI